jgi:leader peptidase (prepilin peptidase)/N-methyltransferase
MVHMGIFAQGHAPNPKGHRNSRMIDLVTHSASIATMASIGAGAGVLISVANARWPLGLGIGDRLPPHDVPVRSRFAIIGAGVAVGVVSVLVQPGPEGLAGAVFGWLLLALLVLDVEHFWLPDRLTFPLAAIGLLGGLWLPPAFVDRVIGCVAGFVGLAGIAFGYRAITGRTGLGGGDPRLFAGIGAWLGWFALPFVLLMASVLGLALVLYDRLSGRLVHRHSRIPLGALLAAAAWCFWLVSPLKEW